MNDEQGSKNALKNSKTQLRKGRKPEGKPQDLNQEDIQFFLSMSPLNPEQQ